MKKFRNKTSGKLAMALMMVLTFASSCRKDMAGLNQDQKLIPRASLAIDGNEASVLLPGMITNIISPTDYLYQLQQNLGQDIYGGYLMTPTPFIGNVNNVTYSLVDGWVNTIWDIPQGNVLNTWLQWKLLKYDTKYPDLYGIALICKAWAASRAADAFGPIPYSKFGESTDVPFDSVKDAYYAFFNDLDLAIAALSKVEDVTPDADQIRFKKVDKSGFGGDYANWIKAANTLKLRLAIRISLIDAAKAKTEAESAVSNKYGLLDATTPQFSVVPPDANPLYTITNAWGDIRLGAPISSILGGYNDPRLPKYAAPAADPAAGGKIIGIRQGIAIADKGTYEDFSLMINQVTTPIVIMNKSESYFLRAEGLLRGWNMGAGTVQSFYEKGIQTSFDETSAGSASAYIADATSTPAAYVDPKNAANNAPPLSSITIKWNDADSPDKKLERIITQKWIAGFPEGCEAWAEFRRTGYPKLYPVKVNNSGGLIPAGGFIRRFTYTTSFTNASKAQVDAAVAKEFGGVDSPYKALWWQVN
ncbi:SusD/RagB family nutrient-binding outer membrane lipoprotein [Mucilaginibacter sp. BJC16-A38]|uniref:SusD/RagB family nutrient-binding outer membrane lipoprotein n=1 Tax=Mucilaginibacter phenanthrenivorans TaxID=1234842 RepID=UPI002157BC2D|nr:SusD/RagB family nutrient-binding outer membrane lipoprotein [Mucilaginibacter phenanthrenivorans]MCR8558917.1 SusD/RagB family nutrient-binding outer membrane lipoprotein [Mucilaginibacter phenanthrenivorans]